MKLDMLKMACPIWLEDQFDWCLKWFFWTNFYNQNNNNNNNIIIIIIIIIFFLVFVWTLPYHFEGLKV
jgi:hypothetical protein